MTQETVKNLDSLQAPYGRNVKLEDVTFDSGMVLLRITIREGSRFTIMDIDAATAAKWGAAMAGWAELQDN